MSILICTPMYGGQCTGAYFRSCLDLRGALIAGGVEHDWLVGWNESLIQRARNSQAMTFLKTDYRKLLFIDADIEFQADDVAKLWNLDTDVAVGLYPMKRLDCPIGAWRNGKLVDLADCPSEPFAVDYAGTGFFMIDRSVLERMMGAYPERKHEEGHGEAFAWFDPRVHDGIYISEDYAFCRDFRAIGGAIIADPSIRLRHWGTHAYGDLNDG